MALTFESFWNISTQKAVTVDDDGYLRQYVEDRQNRKQHWLRLQQQDPSDGTFKMTSRVSGEVIQVYQNTLAVAPFNNTPPNPSQRWKLISTDDGTDDYFVQASNSQDVWTVTSATDGEPVRLLPLGLFPNQTWRSHIPAAFDSVFEIRSIAHDYLVLDVPGFSQVDGGFIQQWQENGAFNQLWEIPPMRDGRTKIRSICSGKLLDYPLQAAKSGTPAAVGQYEENFGDNQTWRIKVVRPGSHGSFDIIQIVSGYPNNDLVLDVPFGHNNPGLYIQVYPSNGNTNQLWALIPM